MSRTKKKKLRGSKAFDRSCRNHGTCPACRSNRTIATARRMAATVVALREYDIPEAV